ncbi:MAG TPA: cytochrome c oxidase assembly protein [Acidimicrobiia bacterium]|nr:cytochrome c oxidase assembly protein [Acidimicrobiia bacterium]
MTGLVAPSAPSWDILVTDWSLDITFPLVIAVAAAYVIGLRRLQARGRPWPMGRTVAFLSGLAVILIATESGVAAYDRVLFSLHVVQHVLLGMVAPLLLVLGAPVTLALQAGSRPTQRRILRVLHTTPARVLAHPLTAWVLFGGSLVVLYFTALYELSLRNDLVHAAVHAHFIAVGWLFLAHVVGVDPIPGALGYGARLLYVMVLLPFHTFIGLALLTTNTVIAADWYEHVEHSWGASPLSDQRTGAGLLWLSGELFGAVAISLAVRQWMAAEDRAAARHDRHLDTVDGSEPIGARGDR